MKTGETDRSLNQLVETVLSHISATLAQGLAPDQRQWAVEVFRTTILPYRLRFAWQESPEQRLQRAEVVSRSLISKLAALTPSRKLEWVRLSYYGTLLNPLSDAAFQLAERVFLDPSLREQLKPEAASRLHQLKQLVADMSEHEPAVLDSLREEVSETTMDCVFVLEEGKVISLRLGRARLATAQRN